MSGRGEGEDGEVKGEDWGVRGRTGCEWKDGCEGEDGEEGWGVRGGQNCLSFVLQLISSSLSLSSLSVFCPAAHLFFSLSLLCLSFVLQLISSSLSLSLLCLSFVLQLISSSLSSLSVFCPGTHPSASSLSTAPCQPCSDAEVLLAVCTSDFVGRGTIQGVEQEAEQLSVTVAISRLYRQKTQVFVSGGVRVRRWTGRVRMPGQCGVRPGPGKGDFLFTGSVRFGEAWMGCAPRYKDFLRLYQEAEQSGTNPCQVDSD
ncbi:meteorin-like protein [Salvelinus sp. IW2-2015]|uniref:meteorin-like protein n=1 Tax=Salvelinus sp. IW2-2015 TaxID=2691554 RepID=UPI0038D4012C